MQASSYPVESLVPHRPPMSLLDEIVSCDMKEGTLSAAFSARREWAENWSAIEYMAQAAAALAGAADRAGGYEGPPKPGFLLGTRKMGLDFDRFEPGKRYIARARSVLIDEEAGSISVTFTCSKTDILRLSELYGTWNSARCYVAAWMGEAFGGKWISVYVWLSPFFPSLFT